MSNLRSIRRSIARHPLNVWRAKRKTLSDQSEVEANKSKPFALSPEDIKRIEEEVRKSQQPLP